MNPQANPDPIDPSDPTVVIGDYRRYRSQTGTIVRYETLDANNRARPYIGAGDSRRYYVGVPMREPGFMIRDPNNIMAMLHSVTFSK